VIAEELGLTLENVTLPQLGHVKRVVANRDTTTLIGGAGERQAIDGRMQQIRAQIEKSTSSYDKEKLEERLAKLSGGVAVIKVGAPSESEMKSKKEALDDAISATKAAVTEGIVPGGGLALLRAISAVTVEAPARTIARNSEMDDGVVVARMLAEAGNIGFDAAAKSYVDMYEAGIIDPTKVVRIGLENAVSIASVLLLTEATLTEVPEKTEKESPVLG
jgi:chaperonin GroEL